jgi:hypothetical protein
MFLGSNFISWSSKKHTTVARLSTEAEYYGLVTVTAELVWLKSLFHEFGLKISVPILLCDKSGAIFLASNPAFYAHTKYIELNYYFVREKVTNGTIQV